MTRSYTDLIQLPTFEERFEYLNLHGMVGKETFGVERWLNQKFYQSPEWKSIRRQVILRDQGCDLGIEERPIDGKVYIHHMNPIDTGDIRKATEFLLDPEYLICVSHDTHNAIHYGDISLLPSTTPNVRTKNDTKLW